MKEYNLSKSELVQLINMQPTTHVELHAIIEECEDRYSENQVKFLFKDIGNITYDNEQFVSSQKRLIGLSIFMSSLNDLERMRKDQSYLL